MFLVELVIQGVRGIRELARLRFQSGFNFVSAGNETGKTSSVDAMLRLLFPTQQPVLMQGLVSRYTPDASRAALVAFSDDGAYYRVIQDFSKRAVNLSKYNAASKDFALVYKDWDNTAQFMAELTGRISEEEYARLFVLRRDHYAGSTASSPAPAAVMRQSASRKTPQEDTAGRDREARLAELREALRLSEEAADADYHVQSGKLRLEEIAKKLQKMAEFYERYTDIDANLEMAAGCDKLPQDIREQLDEHEQRQSQKMAKSDELTQELEDLKMQLDSKPHKSVVTDKLFLLGALLGVLSVVAGLFVLTTEQALYFPLGVLLALMLMAVAWYRGSMKNTERKALLKEVDSLQAELDELEKSFQQGGATIDACMKATGSTTTAELKDKLDNYRYFMSLRNDLDDERKHMLGDISAEDLHSEYNRQQQEIVELEKAAAAMSQYALDSYSLRQDIERLEQEMSGGGGPFDFGGGGEDFSGDFGFASPRPAAPGNGFLAELQAGSRIGGIELETLVAAVEAAAQRNLSAVTGEKYIRIEAGLEGNPLVHARDDSLVNFSELSHGTRELVYFCLRTGLVEALAGKRRLPLILDDPLAGFDPGRQQAACQILRTLGTKTQVILLTSNPALKSAGDAVAELK